MSFTLISDFIQYFSLEEFVQCSYLYVLCLVDIQHLSFFLSAIALFSLLLSSRVHSLAIGSAHVVLESTSPKQSRNDSFTLSLLYTIVLFQLSNTMPQYSIPTQCIEAFLLFSFRSKLGNFSYFICLHIRSGKAKEMHSMHLTLKCRWSSSG